MQDKDKGDVVETNIHMVASVQLHKLVAQELTIEDPEDSKKLIEENEIKNDSKR